MKYGYARVSTNEQHLDLQMIALREHCDHVYADQGVSGSTESRPQLDILLDKLTQGDSVTVWRLDRLGRSTLHLFKLIRRFKDMGVEFNSLTENVDTSTTTGKAFIGFMAVLAEMERDLITDRVNAGISAARARGVVLGRRKRLNPYQCGQAKDLAADGKTYNQISQLLGVSRSTVYRALRAA